MSDLALTPVPGKSAPVAAALPGVNRMPAFLAVAALIAGALFLADAVSGRQAVLYLLGAALGLVLYHAAFGFTGAFRRFLTEGRGAGLRAQMVMLAVAVTLFFPVLAAGSLFGTPVGGIIFPAGVAVIAGAVLFGIGMQVAGACASGTLYTAGGGSTVMLVTLLFFVVGSVAGAAHLPWWNALPRIESVSLVRSLGWLPALALNLAVFAGIYGLSLWIERRRHGSVEGARPLDRPLWRHLLQGPWPLIWGAVALAVLNFATLAVAGRPWGITNAFTLWGSQALLPFHEDVLFWDYWGTAENAAALEAAVWFDITTVMDVGLIFGALLAASLAGRFAPTLRLPLRVLAGAVLGGLLLGYGARIGTGCNISAYVGGIASGSLHGWVWLPAALFGNWLGLYLRPLFQGPAGR